MTMDNMKGAISHFLDTTMKVAAEDDFDRLISLREPEKEQQGLDITSHGETA